MVLLLEIWRRQILYLLLYYYYYNKTQHKHQLLQFTKCCYSLVKIKLVLLHMWLVSGLVGVLQNIKF